MNALKEFSGEEISEDEVSLSMQLLKKSLKQKLQQSDEELWVDDVKSVIKEIKLFNEKARESKFSKEILV